MSKPDAAKRRRQARARAAARTKASRSTAGKDPHVPAVSAPATTANAFDQWLTSLWTLRLAGTTLAIAVCVAVLFAVLLNGRERAQQVYESAQVCTAESTADCVVSLDATISAKSETTGRNPQYFLTLAGPAPASGQFNLVEAPAWEGMNVGDSVTATVWNGQVARITDGPVSGDTSLAPSIQTALSAALFASAIAWVVAFALFALRIFETGRGRSLAWSRALIPVNPAAGLSVFLFPLGSLTGATAGSTLAAVLCGTGLSVVGGSYFVVNWIRRGRSGAAGG